jgi:putative PIN family toxin of toxin-antitoxin system
MVERVVVDTSVFVGALLGSGGPSRAVLRCCLQGAYQPLMGNALFSEYESVIGRERILAQCRLSQAEIDTLLQAFLSVCRWTFIYYTWRPNLKDEADNHLIELAVAGNATAIVTQNIRDFQNAELLFPSLKILTPADILRR